MRLYTPPSMHDHLFMTTHLSISIHLPWLLIFRAESVIVISALIFLLRLPSIYPSIHTFTRPPALCFVCSFVRPSVCSSVHPPIDWSILPKPNFKSPWRRKRLEYGGFNSHVFTHWFLKMFTMKLHNFHWNKTSFVCFALVSISNP